MGRSYTAVQEEDSGYGLNDLVPSTSVTKKAVSEYQAMLGPSEFWTHTHSLQGGDLQGLGISSLSLSSRRNLSDSATYDSVPPIELDEFHDTDDTKQPSQSTEAFSEIQPETELPSVDIGSSTKFQCLLAIAVGTACFLACIISVACLWPRKGNRLNRQTPIVALPTHLPSEALSFIANIILTQCLEGLAYVHSISLRWALLKENRLVFNTNIRLLTSSKLSRPNSWYINSVSAALLILCYGATSTLVLPRVDSFENSPRTYVNLVALLVLGLALFGQTLLAIWCYYNNLHDIPTWSSNPLNTTVTMLKQQSVRHREGRCIEPVQIPDKSEGKPMLPRTQQPSQWQTNATARKANIFIWILVVLSIIWFLIIVLVTRNNMTNQIAYIRSQNPNLLRETTWHFSLTWNPVLSTVLEEMVDTNYYLNALFFSLDSGEQTNGIQSMSFTSALVVSLLFICAIQGLQTLGLHCAELITNSSRDEDVWRALDAQKKPRSKNKNHVLATPPFLAAAYSWKYDMLAIFKSLLHWLLGQAVQPSFDLSSFKRNVYFTMNYARLFIYVICGIIFASAITFLAFVKPKGPQPATYGHIQTIADVIEDWRLDEYGRFWWGDKGCREGIRHAGMSSERNELGPIEMDALYAGEEVGKQSPGGTRFDTVQP